MGRLLLFSGGLDSTALLYRLQPEACLFVNYGQRAVLAEQRCVRFFTRKLGVRLHIASLKAVADGLDFGRLHSDEQKEWIPFRNQLLISFAAWFARCSGYEEILVGSVSTDSRYSDGDAKFFNLMNDLVAFQEKGMTVRAPGIDVTTLELIASSGIPLDDIGWCHSCNVSDVACGDCPSCDKAADVFRSLNLGASD
jgi:7-cyano-7-deazaguanine synthase